MALSTERRLARQRHLVLAAQALIREQGDAGFSMTQLATRAGVSPATPYNLLGGKSEVLRLVVREEFDNFVIRLADVGGRSPLNRLLDATALVVTHYEADRPFYRGLYRAAANVELHDVYDLMSAEGRSLWRGLVRAAMDSGELATFIRVEPFTDLLLRILASTTQAWLAEAWTPDRFALEMAAAVRLIAASATQGALRDRLLDEVAAAHDAIMRSAGPVGA